MSYPILYEGTETEFLSNGIGVLSDAVSCVVTEERNGQFELKMKYPIDGIHYSDIQDRSIVLAKPNPIDDAQPFRVYRTTKPLNGTVTIYARHISYDLSGIPVSPFGATNVIEAFQSLKANAATDCPFTFWTNKDTKAAMSVKYPSAIRPLLGGQAGSVLDVYGGEYKFDFYTVRLYDHRGTDRGVSIRYGKNLLALEQERNCASVYTGVYPYWVDISEGNFVELPEKIVYAPGTYDFTSIKMLDLSSEWQEAPSVEKLRAKAESYIRENNIGVPSVSLTVTHAMLENTEEYKGQALLERIDLCDTVRIEFPKLGVSTSAKANKTEFNVLIDRYESISFGDARKTLADTIAEQNKEVKESKDYSRSLFQQATDTMNEAFKNASGLFVTEDVQPDDSVIYLLHDKSSLEDSSVVIKISDAGVGLSTDGGKTYPYGYTVTGKMVMDFIAANGIDCGWLNAGVLNLGILSLAGTLCGLMQGYGSTGSGRTTQGICIFGNGKDNSGNAKPPYLIVTDAGVRAQISDTEYVYFSGGFASFQGMNITTSGYISAGNNLAAGGKTVAHYESSTDLMQLAANEMRVWLAGRMVYIGNDGDTSETWIRGDSIQSTHTIHVNSDEREKKDIAPLPETYLRMLDAMTPVLYRYRTESSASPPHIGYTTGNVKSALDAAGLGRDDLAALGDYKNQDGENRMSIAYSELIALLHLKIKKLEQEILEIKR